MRIENAVEVDAPVDRVWALVNDIPKVAPCMPGAALTGRVDDNTYKGRVVVEEVDEANHSARLAASGKDTKGGGTARASVQTKLEPAGDTRTRLLVTSDVQLTGKVASFGRGGAISDVASRLFGQFADCLRATLEAEPTSPPAAPPPPSAAPPPASAEVAPAGTTPASAGTAAGSGGTAPASAGAVASSGAVSAGDGSTTAGDGASATPAPTLPATVTRGAAPVSPTPPRAPEALDAGSLVGIVIKGRLQALGRAIAALFRRLLGRRRSRG
jgi:uncharacterized protein